MKTRYKDYKFTDGNSSTWIYTQIKIPLDVFNKKTTKYYLKTSCKEHFIRSKYDIFEAVQLQINV